MFFVFFGFIILFLCIINPFRYAIFFVIYFLFFISPIDAYGIFELIRNGSYLAYYGTAILLIFAYFIFVSYFIIYRRSFSLVLRRFVFSVNILVIFVFFNTLVKELDFAYSLAVTAFTGLFFCTIIPFIKLNNYNINLFVWLVLIKVSLSLLVIFYPDLFLFIDGAFYQKKSGNFVLDSHINSFFEIPVLEKSQVGSYGIFHNPNSLGFHSVLLISFAILYMKQGSFKLKLLAFLFFILGLLGWLNSLTRGPLIFLFISGFYLYINQNKISQIRAFISSVLLASSIVVIILFLDSFLNYLIPSFDNISVTGRLEGYSDGLRVFFENPILGIEKEKSELNSINVPHLFFLFYAYQFGFFPAALVFMIVFSFFIHTVVDIFKFKNINESTYYSTFIIFILLGVALTNNFTAPFTFWTLFTLSFMVFYKNKSVKHAL